jgi:hypothetical protein
MAEDFALTTPEIIPQVTTATYRLVGLFLDWERTTILIRLRGANGEVKSFTYGGSDPGTPAAEKTKALNLMLALNKANLTVKSLQRRVLEQLAADGLLAGAVTGTPD